MIPTPPGTKTDISLQAGMAFMMVFTIVIAALVIYICVLQNRLTARPERMILCFIQDGIPLTIPDECKEK